MGNYTHTHSWHYKQLTSIAIVCVYLILSTNYCYSFDLIKGKNNLSLDTKVRLRYDVAPKSTQTAITDPNLRFEFFGKFKSYKYSVTFETDGYFQNNPKASLHDVLYKAYIQKSLNKKTKITLGKTKVPFGHEFFYSKGKRPYISHPNTTQEIVPGIDWGVLVSKKKFFKKMDVDFGLFNGKGSRVTSFSGDSLLFASKTTFPYDIFKKLDSTFGYSFMYMFENDTINRTTVGHSVFSLLEYKNKKFKLSAFSEYIARRYYSDTYNHPVNWKSGLFTSISIRSGIFEPFIAYDNYDPNTRFGADNNEHLLVYGINIHPKKSLKIGVQWEEKTITAYTYFEL